MFSLSSLFIASAWAQDAQAQQAPGAFDAASLMNYFPLFLIFGVFYFLILRPQQKKMDAQASMQKSLQAGDQVMINNGMYGKIVKLDGTTDVILEIADGVQIKLMKAYITHRLGNGK